MTTSLGPGPGPSDWLALPKGDEFEHSQYSAHRSSGAGNQLGCARMCGRSPCRRCVQCPRPLNGELSERNPSVAYVLDKYNVFDTRPCLL